MEMTALEIIKTYMGKKSLKWIGGILNPPMTEREVRKICKENGLVVDKIRGKNKAAKEEIIRDSELEELNEETKIAQKKYELVSKELKDKNAIIEAFKVIGTANYYKIKTDVTNTKSEVTAVAILSDVHFAETVHSQNVNGKNEYSPKIAKERIEKYFISLVRLIKIFNKESEIGNLVLALLGDLINGQLREEAMENNSMQPMEEMLSVKEILSAGIRYLLDNTSLNITIPCHSGNHARTTKKIHVSTEAGNSLEYVLYHNLAYEFKDNKRIKFIIPTSYHSFVEVGGLTIRFHHGHAMKYLGGIGGIYISVNKAIAQWNKVQRADLDVFGHFHQFRIGGNFVCNGSVIGWNEFANFIKADFEKPKQAFFLIDHKRKEMTVTAPIFLV